MMRTVVLIALAGCEHDLLSNVHDAATDAPADALGVGCPVPVNPQAPAAYKLYLATEGVTLTAGTPSDARLDVSDQVSDGTHVVPPLFDGMVGRMDLIDQIVTDVQSRLTQYSIDVVTTRPSSGDYYLFVLGGDPMTVLGRPCDNCTAVTDITCAVQSRDSVDLIFDNGATEAFTPAIYATLVLDDLGLLNGLPVTTAAGDCQCRECSDFTLCTYGSDVPTSDLVIGNGFQVNCGLQASNEPAELKAVLGCR